MEKWAIISNIVSALVSGGLVAVVNYFRNRRKDQADVTRIYATTEKTIAEAIKIRSDADVTIAKEWARIAKHFEDALANCVSALNDCKENKRHTTL